MKNTEKPTTGIIVDSSYQPSHPDKIMRFWGKDLETGEIIFNEVITGGGTPNVAEYLAIVEADRYRMKTNPGLIIYSDNLTAIDWYEGRPNISKNIESYKNAIVALNKAGEFLSWRNLGEVRKWLTDEWGRNPIHNLI